MTKRVLIFGGTGFLGLSLAQHLEQRGFTPVLVARNKVSTNYKLVLWDGFSLGDWLGELEGAYAIVNLAGKSVDCIKTPDNCDLILRSRVDSTKVVGNALREIRAKPKVWVQMSTAHIYGDPPGQWCDEDASYGYGLAPKVGEEWERAFWSSKPRDIRGVVLRTSFVVGKNGGAMRSLSRITRLGLGGKVGQGNQGMSWIHQHDFNEIVYKAITDCRFSEEINVTSPNPVSNTKFMSTLRKALSIPFGLSSPLWLIRLGARYLFNTDSELAIYGRYVHSKKLKELCFEFRFPFLSDALKDIYQ
ncbi:epimerase [Roseivirga pacifica]